MIYLYRLRQNTFCSGCSQVERIASSSLLFTEPFLPGVHNMVFQHPAHRSKVKALVLVVDKTGVWWQCRQRVHWGKPWALLNHYHVLAPVMSLCK